MKNLFIKNKLSDIRIFFRNIFDGIKNLIKWFPIIWKDRDWDYYFIYDVLKFKLKNTATYIGNRDYHTRAQRDSETMNLCVRLINMIQDDYYSLEYFDYYKDNSHYVPVEGEENTFCFKTNIIKNNLQEYFDKYLSTYKKIEDKSKLSDIEIALRMANFRHNKAKSLLFNLINTHIERWWD